MGNRPKLRAARARIPSLQAPFLVALALSGCTNLDAAFVCQTPSQCVFHGQQGICEPNGFCSFPDTRCGSGRRFGGFSGNSLSNECVNLSNTDGPTDSGMDRPPDTAIDGPDAGDADGPVVLATGQAQPHGIAVSGGVVYWSNYVGNGSIMKKCVDCADSPAPLTSLQPYPIWLAVEPTTNFLYWTNDVSTGVSIQKCSLPNCSGGAVTLVGSQSGGYGLSVLRSGSPAATNVYWITKEAVKTCADGATCPEVTLAANSTYADGTFTRGAGNLVATAQGLFWARNAPPNMGGSIMKCTLPGCNNMVPTVFAPSQNFPWGIIADGDNLYWTERFTPTGQTKTCTLSSGCTTVTSLGTNQNAPVGIVADATTVYWTNPTAGTVVKCARTGCGGMPTVIANGQNYPYGIAVDSTYVYWTNPGMEDSTTGTVMRTKK